MQSHSLSHGVKEFLVERAVDWPGVNSVRAILEGKPLTGYWFNRKAEYAARNRGEEYGRLTYATEETFVLSPLPCWAHLSPEQYRERVAALVAEIEAEAEAIRRKKGIPVLGVRAILQQNPHTEPNRTKRSPAPRFHAASKAVRNALRTALQRLLLMHSVEGKEEVYPSRIWEAKLEVTALNARPTNRGMSTCTLLQKQTLPNRTPFPHRATPRRAR
jgi:hypothetical protein